ncbi:MAG: ATP-binding protein [Bacteroidota bacterium]
MVSGPSTVEIENAAARLRAIADASSLLTGLFAYAPVAFQIYQADGHCLLVNQAFRELFGSEPPPEYNILEDDIAARQGFLPLIHRAFAGETIHVPAFWYDPRELKTLHVTLGRRVAIETTLFPLFDAARAITHVAISFKDVTAQMDLEAERDRLKAANEAQVRSERAATVALSATRRMEEMNRLKSEFLANMSHELRTPLNAIIGFAELLFDGQVDPQSKEHKDFLGDILSSGKHLLQLINDVLDLAKVEAGKTEFHVEPIEPAKLVAEVCTILKSTVVGKDLALEIDVDETLVDVTADPARFKQVLYNYLSNAMKFTPAGGRVLVSVRPEGEAWIRVEVADTGVGIAERDIDRLFVEFQQLEGQREGLRGQRQQGTGLGLALTKRLVEAQGGTVGVRSTLARGSTFHAVLPRRGQSGSRAKETP